MRVAAVQSWPVLTKPATTAPCTAASRFASSNTMNGALPPSSRCRRFTVDDACSMIFLPVAVSPVREIMLMSSCRQIATPTSDPGPVTTFSTPSGMPAWSAALAISMAVNGVFDAGFRTTVFPAARAGPIFQAAIRYG